MVSLCPDSVGKDCGQPSEPRVGPVSPQDRLVKLEPGSLVAGGGGAWARLPQRPALGTVPCCFGQASSLRDGFSVLNPPLESSPCLSPASLGPLKAASLVRPTSLCSEVHRPGLVGGDSGPAVQPSPL